jgi:uncharacterized protein YcfL
MKTSFSVLAAAAVLAVAASEETCDYSVVKPTFHELGTPMAACENATGITFETESTLSLSSTQQSDICSECEDMVDLVYSFTWYDCEMEIDGVNQTLSTYYKTLVGACSSGSSGSTTTATSTTGSSSVETCDYSVVKPDFHQIGTPMASCESATGITFETGSLLSLSSTEQSEICSECTALVDLLYSFTWYDCEMEIDGVNQTVSSYYETLVGSCTNSSSGSSATSSGSSTTTTTSSAETTLLSTAALIASSVLFAAAL